MPNWCYNKLTIHGPAEDIQAFANQASCLDPKEKTELSLQKLCPCPPSLLNAPENKQTNEKTHKNLIDGLMGLKVDPPSIEEDDWYSWRVRNWGTKWDIKAQIDRVTTYKNGNRKIVYSFDSAWSPPAQAFENIAEDWPTLSFRLTYREDGMNYKGSQVFRATPEQEVFAS